MVIEPDKITALVGLSGAGKSTIVNLLDKFYEPQNGAITLDGVDLRQYDTKYLRENIGLVLQKNHIFDGTIEENILYGKPDATHEEVVAAAPPADEPTAAPTMQSEYAGATPVLIDPIDKPTPTPLPPLTFSYQKYEATALHLTFEAPAGWEVDDSQSDTYTLTNMMADMDYAATLSIKLVPVSKNYSKNELIKEVKSTLDKLGSEGFKKFERSNTAGRKFMNTDAIYANYTGTLESGVKIAGRMIIACSEKTLYILHCSYPQGYTKTYVDNVYDKFRHTVTKIKAQ